VAYSDRSRHYPLEIGVSRLGVKGKADLSFMPDKVGAMAESLNVLFEGVSLKEMGKEAPLVTLGSLAVEGGRIDLETRQVTLERIMMEGGHAAMVLEKTGAVNAKGRFTLAQKSAEATVHVSNLALTPFQPYVAQYACLSVDAGDFNAAGKVSCGEGEKGPNLRFSGDAYIADLLVSELGAKLETQLDATQRFLAWQALKANNIKLGLGPERLEIGEVRTRVFLKKAPPKPAPVVVEKVVILDSDGDAVPDNLDKCPGTPKGARVNKDGCWVLGDVLFDFDRYNIKPQFYHLLDEVAVVFEKNPGLRVRIEGHTDNVGTAAYNMKLSLRRAHSVM